MRALILAALLILPLAAKAQTAPSPRTVDMTTVLTDLHGKPIPDGTQATIADPQCAKCGPLTLGTAVALALLTDRGRDEPGLSAIDKAKRGVLAMRLLDASAAVLTAAEAAEIIKLSSILSPMVEMRLVPLIDPAVDLTK